MPASNKATVNFSGGEVSPDLLARVDIPLFNRILSRMQNFIAEPQGPAKFRQGSVFVHWTRRNNPAVFIQFQFSDIQAYIIEATDRYFRFYKEGGIILEPAKTITGVTDANPAVFTSVGHGYQDGDEIFLSGLVGPVELNSYYYLVDRIDADTFGLLEMDGTTPVNSALYDAYVSGGTAERVYELLTPYLTADLEQLQYAQSADVMYIAGAQKYEQRKLTRSSDTSWTLARYTRTADPFGAAKTITAITQANPGVFSAATHGLAIGDKVLIDSVVGMTEVNNRYFTVNTVPTAGTFTLKDETGAVLDTTGYTAYGSAGKVELYGHRKYPRAVAFTDDARLVWGGSLDNPETLWFSRSPDTNGAIRYDDYTTGTDATHALIFTLAPLKGKVDAIRWITSTDKYIAVGTFSSVRRIYGATEAEPITPTSATAKPANSDGVSLARPITDGATTFYIQRGDKRLESIEYDYTIDGYAPDDKNLVTGHLASSYGLKQLARQIATPTIIWAVRKDGALLGLTYKAKENISGWHRHYMGNKGKVKWIAVLPRETSGEQLWMVVERIVNGQTVRYVEFFADEPNYPDLTDFFTEYDPESEETTEDEDFDRYIFALSEKQKEAIHLDCAATYDGAAFGKNASATLTVPWGSHLTENLQTFTTDEDCFPIGGVLVGREIWGGFDLEGNGGGRGIITYCEDPRACSVQIVSPFPFETEYDYPPGQWYITATEITRLDHLEGQTVGLITDGAVPDDQVVANGEILLDSPASVVHVGLRYTGIMKTLPLDQGGVSGPAQSKNKNIIKVAFRFLNAGAFWFGSSLYRLTEMVFSKGNQHTDMPVPLFTGLDDKFYEDVWEKDKTMYLVQNNPLPCTVSSIDIYAETSDE